MTRVLIADDEIAITEVIEEVLVDAGYTVALAHDGDAAIAVLRETAAHIVVSDLMMPRLDGLGVARWMRSRPEYAATPFVLMTAAYVVPAEASALGILVLRKPFDATALLGAIGRALERRSG